MQIHRMTVLLVGTSVLLISLALFFGCSDSADTPLDGGSGAATASGGGGSQAGTASSGSGASRTGDSGGSSTGGTGNAVGGLTGGSSSPTWSTLYASYLGQGTIGHCANCHAWASSATGTYDHLRSAGAIDGTTSPPLVTRGKSILKWFGGTMPQDTNAESPQAVTDFLAWAAAGANRD
jgi:hypothetical protein